MLSRLAIITPFVDGQNIFFSAGQIIVWFGGDRLLGRNWLP
ncbi:hypothetical protein D082_18450 [Synechocystis sp. PCC 6714]|nr:hypothetical protein D082_18450 [Synechocystis sp. PCC 6714]